jgi:adenylate kinase
MNAFLAVSGVPCSGKTHLSMRLSCELGFELVNLTEYALKKDIGYYDEKRDCLSVDTDILWINLKDSLKSDTILDGLFSHLLPATHILVLRCDPRTLLKRMKARGYGRGKILENLEAEYTGAILYEALDSCENVMELDNTCGADMDEIRKWLLKGGVKKIEKDWTVEFTQVLSEI